MFSKAQFVEELRNTLPDVFPTKASAEKAFDAFCNILVKGVSSDETVRLPNVGTFSLKLRARRTGRNPQTGEQITIPAKRIVKFNSSKGLDEVLNK
ncbi:HU family DNA-binding protein [Desulfohalovibrio reitneri]|uniref:HU family DNA-binding protein n=1 Tax=Desulfohalovibrio reitneri TaxID=1307759 RepID=UPI0004A711B1|nr:HU family DNA-binding protein [Desulfohalovibrio reitneri]